MCTRKTLPSFAHPDGTDICSGPWTISSTWSTHSIVPLWPSDLVWRYRYMPLLVQGIIYRLRAPCQLMTQLWIIPSTIVRFTIVTHLGRVSHICFSKLTIIWINAGILLIGQYKQSSMIFKRNTHAFSFMRIHLKMSSGKRWPFCRFLNVLSELLKVSILKKFCLKWHI